MLLLITAIALSGCGGSLYKVKPVTDLPAMSAASKSASAGEVTLRVAPLLADEESQNLFEANLPLSGVLPIRVALESEAAAPIELKRAKPKLVDGQGREWRLLAPKQAVSRILKANGVTLYNPNSRKRFEEEFSSYGIDMKTPLANGQRRNGFLFFQAPDKAAVESPAGLTLRIEKLTQPIQVQLN